MAGKIPDLHATVRAGTGKGAARQARRDGLVPGVVYGGGSEPVAINLPYNALRKSLQEGRFLSTLFNLKVDGQDDVRVICRGVQRDVVKDLPTHVDFMRLRQASKVNLFIPVEFIDEAASPGIKRGGVLTVVRQEIELVVTAGDIPEKVEISLAGLDINDHVSISMVNLPEGVKPTIARDFIIASISAPSGLGSGGDDGEEGGEE